MKRIALLFGLLAFIVGPALQIPEAAATPSPINGGGSGFAALEIDQWRADTARNPYSLKVNYVSQGSTFGRQQFIDGNLDFGASDITFQASEMGQLKSKRCGGRDPAVPGACFVYVPVSAGGLAFMYNLTDGSGNRVKNLQLTRRAACKIFTGAIKTWNDPEIVATNPQMASFGDDIVPVIRGDGAGESFVFSQFCIAVAPDVWNAFIADRKAHDPANVAEDFGSGQPVSNWPQNWGSANPQQYADGVANTVADPVSGRDSITYTAAGYAKVRNFPVASLQNAAGVFTQPDETNVTVALGYASGRGDGTFNLNFLGADPRAYFPSTYSYVIAQTTGFDAGKGEALAKFLCYAVSKGQIIAPSLRYARLSSVLVGIAIASIVKIPGAPSAAACPVAGAPPPPPPVQVKPGQGNGTTGGTTTGGTATGGTTGGSGTTTGGTSAGTATGGTGTGTTGGGDLTTGGSGLGGTTGGTTGGVAADGSLSTQQVSSLNTGTLPLLSDTAAHSSGPDNLAAFWAVIEGAVACAVGAAVVGMRKKADA